MRCIQQSQKNDTRFQCYTEVPSRRRSRRFLEGGCSCVIVLGQVGTYAPTPGKHRNNPPRPGRSFHSEIIT